MEQVHSLCVDSRPSDWLRLHHPSIIHHSVNVNLTASLRLMAVRKRNMYKYFEEKFIYLDILLKRRGQMKI